MIFKTLPIATLAALLTGCAGYNHTLFMTKSNAGLDFDAKPPTAEITISRKEAVIAPAFEGGQTPPVMASFKPDIGANGPFVNFFLGVDQTFAGGDAARVMSELYNESTPKDRNPSTYDSTLKLTTEPKGPIKALDVAKPGKIRPFIFGTDTMLGLKVAWSGAGGQMPDTVKAGFNRKEFAWAPLTMTTNNTSTPWQVKMPSFLATIDSQIQAGTNKTGITALQYFATGEAATRLALQPDVRAAMLYRLDPNQEEMKKLGKILGEGGPVGLRAEIAIASVFNGIKTLCDAGDTEATRHLAALNALGKLTPEPDSLVVFSCPTSKTTLEAAMLSAADLLLDQSTNRTFVTFQRYQSRLRSSVNELSGALARASFQYRRPGATNAEIVTTNSPTRTDLAAILDLQRREIAQLAVRVSNDSAAAAAVRYYCNQLAP